MTNPTDQDSMDRRAQIAAADLHARAHARPVPTFDPQRPVPLDVPAAPAGRGLPQRRVWLAAAAAFIVLAATAGWAVARTTSKDDDKAAVTTSTLQGYLATFLPDGLSLAGVGETNGDEQRTGGARAGKMEMYGPDAETPRLGLFVVDGNWNSDASEETQVAVGDKTGYLLSSSSPRTLIVPLDGPSGGRALYVLSSELDEQGLAAVAEAATTEELTVSVPDSALPDGWSRLGTQDDPMAAISPMAAAAGLTPGPTKIASYLGQDEGVAITSRIGSSTDVNFMKLILPDARTETIRGHQAVMGSVTVDTGANPDGSGTNPTWVATWEERPGEIVTVSANQLSQAQVLQIADGVRAATPTEWAELVEKTALGDISHADEGDPMVEMGRGSFGDGTAWVLRYQASSSGPDGETAGSLDLSVALTGSSSSGSTTDSVGTAIGSGGDGSADIRDMGSTTTLDKGGRRFAAGLVTDKVAEVELRDASGATVGTAEMVHSAGRHAWVAELTEATTSVVAIGADGQPLEDHPIGDQPEDAPEPALPGSPTTTGG